MRILFPMQAKGLSDNTLDAVSFNCAPNFPVHTDSEPTVIGKIRTAYQCKTSTMQTATLAVNSLKLPAFSQKGAFTQMKFPQRFRQKASYGLWLCEH